MAVFSPIPAIPIILSEGSPRSPLKSGRSFGKKPNRSSTAFSSYIIVSLIPFFKVNTCTFLLSTSCSVSMSPEAMTIATSLFAFIFSTIVPSMSSASNPGLSYIGISKAVKISRERIICATNSGSAFLRPALYSS